MTLRRFANDFWFLPAVISLAVILFTLLSGCGPTYAPPEGDVPAGCYLSSELVEFYPPSEPGKAASWFVTVEYAQSLVCRGESTDAGTSTPDPVGPELGVVCERRVSHDDPPGGHKECHCIKRTGGSEGKRWVEGAPCREAK